ADLDYGSVLNVATATGEDPDGDPVAPVDPATVTVDADQTPIVADDDTPPTIDGYEGGTPDESVLENDLLGGTSVDPGEITLNVDGSEVTAPVPFDDGEGNPVTGIVMNPDGTVTVSPGTPAGEYTLEYTICEVLNTSNREGATVTITVTPGVIEATDDTPPAINGKDGGTPPSVLRVPYLTRVRSVAGSEIPAPGPFDDGEGHPVTGIVLNPNGTVTVSPGTPA